MLEGVTIGIIISAEERNRCVVIHLLIANTLISLEHLHFNGWFFSEVG
jgi:hypothetical protein